MKLWFLQMYLVLLGAVASPTGRPSVFPGAVPGMCLRQCSHVTTRKDPQGLPVRDVVTS